MAPKKSRLPHQPSASDRFLDLTTKMMSTHFPVDSKNSQHRKAFANYLFDLPGPKSVKPEPKPESKFIRTLVVGSLEIYTASRRIANARRYFLQTPRGISQSKSDYLEFVLYAYLNELYVLEERMCAYVKALARAASRNSDVRKRLEKIVPNLLERVCNAFRGTREVRGSHIHRQRFRDEEVGRLSSLELVVTSQSFRKSADDFTIYELLYRNQLRKVKRSWRKRFQDNETAIETLLNQYFEVIMEALLEKNGSLRVFV